jgi:hypothetical protein
MDQITTGTLGHLAMSKKKGGDGELNKQIKFQFTFFIE